MKTLWTSREFLSVTALIALAVIVLAVYTPASQAAKSNLVATQLPSTRRVMATALLPAQTRAGSLSVRIVQPAKQTHYWYGDAIPVTLVASTEDANHQPIPDSAIVWTDNLDGTLGTGATLRHVFLSGGTYSQHSITATATTADGKNASDTITIEIGFAQ
jgi:hypothetical protein